MEPYELSLSQASAFIASGDLTPSALTESLLQRIQDVEPHVNAFVTVTADAALRQAADATEQISRGLRHGPLYGIPLAVKDLIDTAGVPTTASSRLWEDRVPDQDAAVVSMLSAAGMITIGKTHTHEFAYGGVTPATRNPWDLGRVTGGSSGGSAAAVSYGGAPAAIGTDTAGSIRIPAALCGIVGLKPTYGSISRVGIAPLSWSLDHVGPLTRTVTDAALVLTAMTAYDPADPGSRQREPSAFTEGIDVGIAGLRIGIPTNYFTDRVDPETTRAVQEAVDALADQGASIVPVEIPHAEHLGTVITGIMMPEASTYHRRTLRESPELYTDEVRGLLEVGEKILATDYIHALRFRQVMKSAWQQLMRRVDVVIAPTVFTTALPADESVHTWPDGTSETASVGYGRLSIPASLCGLPSLQVPCGLSRNGLPIGMQIIGRPFAERTVLSVGRAHERHSTSVGALAPI